MILAKYETMNAWADVIPALQALRKEGLILCFLSNMTSKYYIMEFEIPISPNFLIL